MLSKDLMLVQNSIIFENLTELLESLDDYASLYNSAIERYGERLGSLIRQEKASSYNQAGGQGREPKKENQKRFGGREDKSPWFVFDLGGNNVLRIANTMVQSPAAAESAFLFRIIEALKDKVRYLELARRKLSELPSKGIRADQRFIASFVDGLPRQVVPTTYFYNAENRFLYKGEFEVYTMEETEALSISS